MTDLKTWILCAPFILGCNTTPLPLDPRSNDPDMPPGPTNDGPTDPVVGNGCGTGNPCPYGYLCDASGKCEVAPVVEANCEFPQTTPPDAGNDAGCPSVYGGPLASLCYDHRACTVPGLTCRYYGVGDGEPTPGCRTIAMMWCKAAATDDGGTELLWVCAN